jgi:hypothetical protein
MGVVIYIVLAVYLVLMGLALRYHHFNFHHNHSSGRWIAAVEVWRECYKAQFYWAEIPLTIRRVLFFLCAKVWLTSASRSSILIALLFLSETLLIQFKWYVHDDDNYLEIFLLANAVIFFSFAGADFVHFEIVSAICVTTAILAFIFVLSRQYHVYERIHVLCAGICSDPIGLKLLDHHRSQSESQDVIMVGSQSQTIFDYLELSAADSEITDA